jgi:hypothetical protein
MSTRSVTISATAVLSTACVLGVAVLSVRCWRSPLRLWRFAYKGESCRCILLHGRVVFDNHPEVDLALARLHDATLKIHANVEQMRALPELSRRARDFDRDGRHEEAREARARWKRDASFLEQDMERLMKLTATPLPRRWTRSMVWPVPTLFAVLSVMPGVVLLNRLRRRRRAAADRCVHCGYDLRATPERCPECGAPAPAQPTCAVKIAADH